MAHLGQVSQQLGGVFLEQALSLLLDDGPAPLLPLLLLPPFLQLSLLLPLVLGPALLYQTLDCTLVLCSRWVVCKRVNKLVNVFVNKCVMP